MHTAVREDSWSWAELTVSIQMCSTEYVSTYSSTVGHPHMFYCVLMKYPVFSFVAIASSSISGF